MTKLIQKLMMCCLMLMATTAVFGANGSFGGGNGSSGSPYVITDAADLNAVRNGLALHYVLGNDIDLTTYLAPGGVGYNSGSAWAPIGASGSPFTGSFNGAGHTISGLWIYRSTDNVGLYSMIKNKSFAGFF